MEIKWLVAPEIKKLLAVVKIQRWIRLVLKSNKEMENILVNEAATIIQRQWRRYIIQQNILKIIITNEAAGMIQFWYRKTSWKRYSYLTRRSLLRLKWDIKSYKIKKDQIELEILDYKKVIIVIIDRELNYGKKHIQMQKVKNQQIKIKKNIYFTL